MPRTTPRPANDSMTRPVGRAPRPWPLWARTTVLLVGLAASVAAAWVAVVAVLIFAVFVEAAPLLAGSSTPLQPWVEPAAFCAGVVAFVLGCWLSVRTFRRHGSA